MSLPPSAFRLRQLEHLVILVARRSAVCMRILATIVSLLSEVPLMPQGDKSKYTDKQKRKAEHIADSYEDRGTPPKEAKRRAWATVNKESGGGNKSGSGRGKPDNKSASKKGGKKGGAASAARPKAARVASAKKAAATRKKKAAKKKS